MVSKAFCRSMRIIPVNRPESKPVSILSVKYARKVSVEWFLRNPDWYLQRTLFSVKRFMVWSCITFSIILETIGTIKPKNFRISLSAFIIKRLELCYLIVFQKMKKFMDKLQIWVTGMANPILIEGGGGRVKITPQHIFWNNFRCS